MDTKYFEQYPESEIDLHGLLREEALYELSHFIAWAKSHGLSQIRIITGKGIGSFDNVPVIRNAVLAYLNTEGYHYETGGMFSGGEGVLYVSL